MKHLLQLLKVAYQERDEAREQLQKILNKVMPSSPSGFLPVRPQLQPESPRVKPTKANSSITESNSLSETTYNHPQSHGSPSPPVDSFFDTVTSPDLSNITMADSNNMAFVNQPIIQEYNGSLPGGLVSSGAAQIDQASVVIDNLVKGKELPQKGKLLQAVMEAGPLLQTLLVAGPLPQWRNPPTMQSFQIPPVSIKGCDTAVVNQKPAANQSYFVHKPLNTSPYVEMSCGSSQMLSSSMLNFGSSPNGSCFSNGGLLASGGYVNNQIPTGKRQRFHWSHENSACCSCFCV